MWGAPQVEMTTLLIGLFVTMVLSITRYQRQMCVELELNSKTK